MYTSCMVRLCHTYEEPLNNQPHFHESEGVGSNKIHDFLANHSLNLPVSSSSVSKVWLLDGPRWGRGLLSKTGIPISFLIHNLCPKNYINCGTTTEQGAVIFFSPSSPFYSLTSLFSFL